MKREYIHSLLTLFLSGCTATPWQSDTSPSTLPDEEIVISQSNGRIPEVRKQKLQFHQLALQKQRMRHKSLCGHLKQVLQLTTPMIWKDASLQVANPMTLSN